MFGHICQAPKDLVTTRFVEEWFGEFAVTKTSATHRQCLKEGIVVILPLIKGMTGQKSRPLTSAVRSNHGVWRGCINTASHTISGNATQKIENIGFCGRLGQLGETVKEALEAHGFSTQSLSGNCSHVGVASTHEGLETDSVINITTNLRAIEQPRLDGVRTCNDVIL